MKQRRSSFALAAYLGIALLIATLAQRPASAQDAGANGAARALANRGDIRHLPEPLKSRLVELARRPRSFLPVTAFSEADKPSQLFQYYLLDTTGFESNVFTAIVPGINDGTKPTATGPNGQLPTIGSVRVVLEPKPGLPTDPNDVRAAIDVFTDISGLFVINNEFGWYEGWMIHDLRVPRIAPPRPNGRAQYGTITPEDAAAIRALSSHNNVPGNFFTVDGNAPRLPSATDHFPERQTNLVSFPVSIGTFNAQQQSDIHAYWEFNPGTDWVFPHYELPFTGGIPGTFEAGQIGALQSIVPGSGPAGVRNDPVGYGDRAEVSNISDPDRPTPGNSDHLEKRLRFIPSRLTDEVIQDVFTRVRSFEPRVTGSGPALFDAYAYEVSLVDQNGDGVISFEEANVNHVGRAAEYASVPAGHCFRSLCNYPGD